MTYLLRLVPIVLVELLARLAGYCVNLFRPVHGYPAEKKVRGLYWGPYFKASSILVGRNVQFEGANRIALGDRVRINDGCQLIAGSVGNISIGADSHAARDTIIAGGGGIRIGERCMISSQVGIYSVQNRIGEDKAALLGGVVDPVQIGDDVFIGLGAKILPGVTIGDRAVIAAGALVTKSVAADATVAGVPAKLLKN